MKRTIGMAAVAVCSTAGLFPVQAAADEPGKGAYVVVEDRWQVDAIIYGWLPTIEGKSNIPLGSGDGFTVHPRQILDHIKLGFLGGLGVHKGDWGAFADLIYLSVGEHKQGPATIETPQGPVTGTADVNLDIKSTVLTFAGTYTVLKRPELGVDLFAGARLLDMKQTADLVGVDGGAFEGVSRHGAVSQNFWNGIVGAKGRINFGPDLKWFLPFYADVGTGDSAFTWQLMAGFGYRFGWGDIGATYRYMDFNGKSSDPVDSISFQGPMAGVALHW